MAQTKWLEHPAPARALPGLQMIVAGRVITGHRKEQEVPGFSGYKNANHISAISPHSNSLSGNTTLKTIAQVTWLSDPHRADLERLSWVYRKLLSKVVQKLLHFGIASKNESGETNNS